PKTVRLRIIEITFCRIARLLLQFYNALVSLSLMHARSPRQTKANNLSASYQGRIVPAAGLFVSPILLPCIHASNEWEMNRTEKSFRRDMALGHKGAPCNAAD